MTDSPRPGRLRRPLVGVTVLTVHRCGSLGRSVVGSVGTVLALRAAALLVGLAGAFLVFGGSAGADSVVVPVSTSGTPVAVAVDAGASQSLTFSGTAGMRVTVGVAASTFDGSASLSLVAPDGSVAGSGQLGSGGRFFGPFPLATTGVYAVVVASGGASGSGRVSVSSVPADAAGVVGAPSIAGASSGTLGVVAPGQGAVVAFTGTIGERVSVRVDGSSVGYGVVAVAAPDGSPAGSGWFSYGRSLVGPLTLGSSGVFAVRLAPSLGMTGSLRVVVFDVPADVSAATTASPGGTHSDVVVQAPGQQAGVSFSPLVGSRIAVRVAAGASLTRGSVSLLNDAGAVAGSIAVDRGGGLVGPLVVAGGGGVWRVRVDGEGETGSVALDVFAVPDDATGQLVVGGAPTGVAITAPGQLARLTMTLTAGDRVAIDASASSVAAMTVRILGPDGGEVVRASCGVGACQLPVFDAVSSGVYTLAADPAGAGTGAFVVGAVSVVALSAATITTGGSVSEVFAGRGQSADLIATATAGSRVSLVVGGTSLRGVVRVRDGAGGVIADGPTGDGVVVVGPFLVPASGGFLVGVEAANAGPLALRMESVVVDTVTGTVGTVTDPALPVVVTGAGAVGRVDAALTRLESIRLDVSTSTLTNGSLVVRDPDGSIIETASFGVGDTVGAASLVAAVGGRYSFSFTAPDGGSGGVAVRFVRVARPATAISAGAPARLETLPDGVEAAATVTTNSASTRMSVLVSNASQDGVIRLLDGGVVVASGPVAAGGGFFGPVTVGGGSLRIEWVPTDGTVGSSLLVDPEQVAPDTTGVLDTDAASHSFAITTPGQGAVLRFHADTGEQVALAVTTVDPLQGALSVVAPDGTIIANSPAFSFADPAALTVTASATGWYRIVIAPARGSTGVVGAVARDLGGGGARSVGLDDPSVAVNIAAAISEGVVLFDAPAGARVSVFADDSTISGRLRLVDGAGGILADTPISIASGASSLPVVVAGGTYRIVVVPDPGEVGGVRVRAASAGADVALAATTDGASVSAATTRPGQRVAVSLTTLTAGIARIALHAPGLVGATLTVTTSNGSTSVPLRAADQVLLVPAVAAAGSITVLVDPVGAVTGAVSLSATTTARGVLAGDGVAVSVLTLGGVDAPVSYHAAVAGGRVAVAARDGSAGFAVALRDATGAVVASATPDATGSAWLGVQTLPVVGDYPLVLSHPTGISGAVTVTAYDTTDPAPVALVGSATAPITITTPGIRNVFALHAHAGDRVALRVADSTISSLEVVLTTTDGTLVTSTTIIGVGAVVPVVTAPSTGIYRILVFADGAETGTATIRGYDAPAPTARIVAVNGAPLAQTIASPGGAAAWAFSADAGWHVSVSETGTISDGTLRIEAADGSIVATTPLGGAITTLTSGALPASGRYRVVVDPAPGTTGTATVTVTSPDNTTPSPSSIVVGGDAVTLQSAAGASSSTAITAEVGARILVESSGASGTGTITLTDAIGATLASGALTSATTFLKPITVPTGGVLVTISAPTTTATALLVPVTVLDASPFTAPISVGDAITRIPIDVPGGDAQLQVDREPVDHAVTLALAASTISPATITITTPSGTLASSTLTGEAGTIDFTIPATMPVTIMISAAPGEIGSVEALLLDPSMMPTITPAPVPVALEALSANALLAAPSGSFVVGGQDVTPTVKRVGGGFALRGGFQTTRVPRDPRDATTLPTTAGDVVLSPVGLRLADPLMIASNAVVYQGVARATDEIIRPTTLGAESFLQLRGADAPATFSWTAHVPDGAVLEQVSSTRVAVIALAAPGDPATPLNPLNADTTIPTSLTSHVTDPSGQLTDGVRSFAASSDATLSQYPPLDTGDSGRRLTTTTAWHVLAVVDAAWARDAAGTLVATTLHVSGQTITLTIAHQGAALQYPVLVDPVVSSDAFNSTFRDYQRLWADEPAAQQVTEASPEIQQCLTGAATGPFTSANCVRVFSSATGVIDEVNNYLGGLPYGYAANEERVRAFRHAIWVARTLIDLEWATPVQAANISEIQAFISSHDPGASAIPASVTNLGGADLCGLYVVTAQQCALQPPASTSYTPPAVLTNQLTPLDTASFPIRTLPPGDFRYQPVRAFLKTWANGWGATTIAPVADATKGLDRLGLERQYAFTSGSLGWGAQWLVNNASAFDEPITPTTTTPGATPQAPNVLVHWVPLSAPGKGLSTVVSVNYNSQEQRALPVGPRTAANGPNALGPGWLLSISSLTPLNEGLAINSGEVSFRDIDGTTHTFEQSTGATSAGVVEYWPLNGEQLYLARVTTGTTPVTTWQITTRSGVTYDYNANGWPLDVRDANANQISYSYDTTTGPVDGHHIIAVVDQRGRAFTISYASTTVTDDGYWRVMAITGHQTLTAQGAASPYLPTPSLAFNYTAGVGTTQILKELGRCASTTGCVPLAAGTTPVDHYLEIGYTRDLNGVATPLYSRTAPNLASVTTVRSATASNGTFAISGDTTTFSAPTLVTADPTDTRSQITITPPQPAAPIPPAVQGVNDATTVTSDPRDRQTIITTAAPGSSTIDRMRVVDLDLLGRPVRVTDVANPADRTQSNGNQITTLRWADSPGYNLQTGKTQFLSANRVDRTLDATGAITTTTYTPLGSVASVTTDDLQTTRFGYTDYNVYPAGSTTAPVELETQTQKPSGAFICTDRQGATGALIRAAGTPAIPTGAPLQVREQYDHLATPTSCADTTNLLARTTTYSYYPATAIADNAYQMQTITTPSGDTTTVDRWDANGQPERVSHGALEHSYTLHDAQGNTIYAQDPINSSTLLADWTTTESSVDALIDDPDVIHGTWATFDAFGRPTATTFPKSSAIDPGRLYLTRVGYDDPHRRVVTSDQAWFNVVPPAGSTVVDPYAWVIMPSGSWTPVAGVGYSEAVADELDRPVLAARHSADGPGATTPGSKVTTTTSDTAYTATGDIAWTTDPAQSALWNTWHSQNQGSTLFSEQDFGVQHFYDAVGNEARRLQNDFAPAANSSLLGRVKTRQTYSCWNNAGRLVAEIQPITTPVGGVAPKCTYSDLNYNTQYRDLNYYDSVGHVVFVRHSGRYDYNSGTYGTDRYTYTADGQVATHTDGNGDITRTFYNDADEPYLTSVPVQGSTWSNTYTSYNADGQVAAMIDPKAVLAAGLLNGTSTAGPYSTYSAVVAAAARVSGYGAAPGTTYDYTCGRLTSVRHSLLSPASAIAQSYLYDLNGRVTSISPWDTRNRAATYGTVTGSCATKRDAANGVGWTEPLVSSVVLLDTGAIGADNTPGRNAVAYAYADPMLPTTKTSRWVCTAVTLALGSVAAGAPCGTSGAAEPEEQWAYDHTNAAAPALTHSWLATTQTVETFANDADGRVTSAATPGSAVAISYDNYGNQRVVKSTTGATYTTTYDINDNGQLQSRTDTATGTAPGTPSVVTTNYQYLGETLAAMLITGAGVPAGNETDYQFDPAGQLIGRVRYDSNFTIRSDQSLYYLHNGAVSESLIQDANAVTLEQHQYTYVDAAGVYGDGNILSERIIRHAAATSIHVGNDPLRCTTSGTACTNTYSYDDDNRLTRQITQSGWESTQLTAGGTTNVGTSETDCLRYNASSLVTSTWRFPDTDTAGTDCTGGAPANKVTNSYSATNQLTSQTVNGPREYDLKNFVRKFVYNAAGDVCVTRREFTSLKHGTTPASCTAALPVPPGQDAITSTVNNTWWYESQYTYGAFDRIDSHYTYNEENTVTTNGITTTTAGAQNADTYTYDAFGRIATDTSIYHLQGEQLRTWNNYVGTTPSLFEQHYRWIGTSAGTSPIDRTIASGLDGAPAAIKFTPNIRATNAGTYYPHQDGTGKTTLIQNKDGSVYETFGQLPDGTPVGGLSDGPDLTTGWLGSIITKDRAFITDMSSFSGATSNSVNNANNGYGAQLGQRQYKANIGAFSQFDTYHDPNADLQLVLNPLTNNRSAYGAANPVGYADYDGHFPFNPHWMDHVTADFTVAGEFALGMWDGSVGGIIDTFAHPLDTARGLYSCASSLVECTVAMAKSCVSGAHGAGVCLASVIGTKGLSKVSSLRHAAKDVADTAVGDAARACGLSFSPDTRVLLADGTTRPIAQLKPGDLVVATDTHTGTTRTQTVQAVLINHDSDLLDVRVEDASGRVSTIRTTAKHPFWDATTHVWVRAGVFPIGDELQTIDGRVLRVAALVTPPAASGEMWDLTVSTDHDFYIRAGSSAVLVHNCGRSLLTSSQAAQMADRVGFRATSQFSKGQRIFTDGKRYITQDIDSHSGGLWKMARTIDGFGLRSRLGTYDYDLNRIGG